MSRPTASGNNPKVTKLLNDAESFFADRENKTGFDREAWDQCAKLGALAVPLPESFFDGFHAGIETTMAAHESLGKLGVDPGLLFSMGAHVYGCTLPVAWYANEFILQEYAHDLAYGKKIGALAVTEPESGSNPFAMKTSAVLENSVFRLNGEKTLITNAPIADVFLVVAATKQGGGMFGVSAFLVPKNAPGLSITPAQSTSGLHGSPMGTVTFNNCKIDQSYLIGAIHTGFRIFTKAMLWERTGILAGFLGCAERDLENCIDYVNQRSSGSSPIASYQSISHRIAQMKIRLETSRLMLGKAAHAIDNNDKVANTCASMANFHTSESILTNATDSMRILAGSGWVNPDKSSLKINDALGTVFASGTSEVQLNIIAASLGLRSS